MADEAAVGRRLAAAGRGARRRDCPGYGYGHTRRAAWGGPRAAYPGSRLPRTAAADLVMGRRWAVSMAGLAAAGMAIERKKQKKGRTPIPKSSGWRWGATPSSTSRRRRTRSNRPPSSLRAPFRSTSTRLPTPTRRLLQNNQVPPPGAVRIEEMVNYFSYDYPEPKRDQPVAVDMEAAGCPWNGDNRLVRVGLKAREVDAARRARATSSSFSTSPGRCATPTSCR